MSNSVFSALKSTDVPQGHILCENCAVTIIEKCSPRLQPACPYCRENFSVEGIRVIRIDFSQSSGGGPSGPSESLKHSVDTIAPLIENDSDQVVFGRSRPSSTRPSRAASQERGGVFRAIDEDHVTDFTPFDANKHRERGSELERLVYKVASKRCSVQELQGLRLDLKKWLDRSKHIGEGDGQVCISTHDSFRIMLTIIYC